MMFWNKIIEDFRFQASCINNKLLNSVYYDKISSKIIQYIVENILLLPSNFIHYTDIEIVDTIYELNTKPDILQLFYNISKKGRRVYSLVFLTLNDGCLIIDTVTMTSVILSKNYIYSSYVSHQKTDIRILDDSCIDMLLFILTTSKTVTLTIDINIHKKSFVKYLLSFLNRTNARDISLKVI